MKPIKVQGFTLIEVMIVIAILAIVAKLATSVAGTNEGTVSFGINGITEMRCINGFQFVIGDGGQARQVLDEFGKGVRC